ncbi:rRNA maturation RNase YbeY [Cohnella sp. CFH 77786]|uniref:rRNA maturation RNase YbeY n=1 Tax=Cohnella sp. CFH 77786 TaxID=2662265 RepID=UPI001C60D333|nr:rRNA maturation RNase YbeY [Cohnella sp. CFH 77786]MBW5444882.1 rRNA maturation RNase YbeY [Cohnella sp. CFH 77786]
MTLSLEWIDEREGGAGPKEEAWMELLERLLNMAGEAEGVDDGIVTVTLTDDEGIRELNRQFRGLDKPTDVLSFSLVETVGEEPLVRFDEEYEGTDGESGAWEDETDAGDPFSDMLGDIVISVPRAEAQAAEYGHSFERELGFLFVHGFLHLLGYDHDNEEREREMFSKQEDVLAKAGLTR